VLELGCAVGRTSLELVISNFNREIYKILKFIKIKNLGKACRLSDWT